MHQSHTLLTISQIRPDLKKKVCASRILETSQIWRIITKVTKVLSVIMSKPGITSKITKVLSGVISQDTSHLTWRDPTPLKGGGYGFAWRERSRPQGAEPLKRI